MDPHNPQGHVILEDNFKIKKLQNTDVESSKLYQVLIKVSCGLIKNEKQASYFSIMVVLLAAAVSLFFVLDTSTPYDEKVILPIPVAGEANLNN